MTLIHIHRLVDYGTPEEGMFGTLTMGDFTCYTVERQWLDNTPSVSCIPAGDYYAEWYNSPKFGPSIIIYGGTVSKGPTHGYPRSGILIHPANWSYQLQGCIGLGDKFSILNNMAAVSNSRKTVADFLKRINIGEEYFLRITQDEMINETSV